MLRFSYTVTNRFRMPIRTVSFYDGEAPVVRVGYAHNARLRKSEIQIDGKTAQKLDSLLSTEMLAIFFERSDGSESGEMQTAEFEELDEDFSVLDGGINEFFFSDKKRSIKISGWNLSCYPENAEKYPCVMHAISLLKAIEECMTPLGVCAQYFSLDCYL